jgi:hypothetical protein
LVIITFSFGIYSPSFGQYYEPCGFQDTTHFFPSSAESTISCFAPLTVDDIFDDELKVYIKVNMHFYMPNVCCGLLDYVNIKPSDAFSWSENFINQANAAFENNPAQWQTNSPAQAVPFRYVLKGVYIHCREGATFSNVLPNEINNPDSEINAYIVNTISSGVAVWYTTYPKRLGLTQIATNIFNHEIGHCFQLQHPQDNQNPCSDFGAFWVSWDANCNGVKQDWQTVCNPAKPNEMKWVRESKYWCWTYIGQGSPWPNTPCGEADKNNNGIHDCNEPSVNSNCTASPCCDFGNINNNLMGHLEFSSALTECQIKTMLRSADKISPLCSYIEDIIDPVCPPPSAFINQIPIEKNTDLCYELLYLEASHNETEYKLVIVNLNQQQTVYSTGWLAGKAKNYFFSASNQAPSSFGTYIKLNPNTTYKAILSVKNDCGVENQYDYRFTTSAGDISGCGGIEEVDCNGLVSSDPVYELFIAPNPTTGSSTVSFDGELGEIFQIKTINTFTGNSTIVQANYPSIDGQNQVEIYLGGLPTGSYKMEISSTQKKFIGSFIKL